MPPYPDLTSCGIHSMRFSFHVSGGLEDIDEFWEKRGLDRSKERLLFKGYSRSDTAHTVYLGWTRSHDTCCDVFLGIEARQTAQVWPRRSLKVHRLRDKDFREFIAFVRQKEVPLGIRARYTYPSPGPLAVRRTSPRVLLKSMSVEVRDAERKALTLTFERYADQWFITLEPAGRFPFPDSSDFFAAPFETGCGLASSIITEQPK